MRHGQAGVGGAFGAYVNEVQPLGKMPAYRRHGDRPAGHEARRRNAVFREAVAEALAAQGYRQAVAAIDRPWVVAILFYLMLLVTMVYGPIAAALAEMFPTRIRIHEPAVPPWQWLVLACCRPWRFAIVAQTGDIYSGLWYPVSLPGPRR